MCCWVLPYPVGATINHLYEGYFRSRRLRPAAQAWKDTAILTIRQKAIDGRDRLELPTGQLAFSLDVYPPDDKREHDGDNVLKFTVDSVMAAFGEKDPRVVEYHVWRHEASDNPRLVVWVTQARTAGREIKLAEGVTL